MPGIRIGAGDERGICVRGSDGFTQVLQSKHFHGSGCYGRSARRATFLARLQMSIGVIFLNNRCCFKRGVWCLEPRHKAKITRHMSAGHDPGQSGQVSGNNNASTNLRKWSDENPGTNLAG